MILVVRWFELQARRLSIDLRFKRFGCQSIWDSNDLVVNRFEIQVSWLSIDLRFKWFGCQPMCASNDFGCLLIWTSSEAVVNWSEIQVIWLSIDLRFKWVGCQLIWDSSDLDVRWFEVQLISLSTDVWFMSNEAFLRDLLQKRSFEDQKRSFSARLPSKMKLWGSKTKLLCETSFKNETLKLKNEAFLRDFLQKWNFEAQKRSFSARLPSKWRFGAQKRSFCARLPSKIKLWSSKTKLLCEASFKNDMSHLTSEFECDLAIFEWMLQKYCACHEKAEPRHTKSCNCHAKWSLQSNTSVTWNLQPFHGFCLGGFKHRHHKARNPCACQVKRIVSEPLQIHHACQRFCNPHELLRLPRILQRVEIRAPATQNALWTSKNVPSTWCFNDFDFQIAFARRRGAILRSSTSKSAPNPQRFNDFDFQIALARRRGANLVKAQLPKVLRNPQALTILASELISRAGVVQIVRSSTSKSAPTPPAFNDFGFQIALARRRGANFIDILGSRSSATPVFRTWLCEPSKPRNYGKTQHFAQFYPPKSLTSHICAVKHLCCRTSMLQDLPATFSIVGS